MTTKPPSRTRPLSAEEAELWAFAMRDAKALRRRRAAHAKAAGEQGSGTDIAPQSEAQQGAQKQTRGKPAGASLALRQNPPNDESAAPPATRFDERQRRKLARDAESIDARLDLHGMRQREAHSALRSFLFASAARGHRNILVITGKGTRAELDRARDFLAEERGVLRRLVPKWLGEPEFRTIVLSFTTAGVRHGGEGALYVRLRKFPRGS